MKKHRLQLLALLILFGINAAYAQAAQAEERVKSKDGAFSMIKPAGWHALDMTEMMLRQAASQTRKLKGKAKAMMIKSIKDSTKDIQLALFAAPEKKVNHSTANIKVTVSMNAKMKTLAIVAKEKQKRATAIVKDSKILESSDITIDGQAAKRIVIQLPRPGKLKTLQLIQYILIKDDKIYTIICTMTEESFASQHPAMDAAAQSLTFE